MTIGGEDRDVKVHSEGFIDCTEPAPELEALHRWAMVLHHQYPWNPAQAELVEVGQLEDDDYVVVLHPRNEELRGFLRHLDSAVIRAPSSPARDAIQPVRPYPAVSVHTQFLAMPRIEALAAVHGDQVCTNDDLIRNAAYNWSPISAEEIRAKTGIEQRLYTTGRRRSVRPATGRFRRRAAADVRCGSAQRVARRGRRPRPRPGRRTGGSQRSACGR
jgi:3-oxoacyl-[acyl-carrier-protein] synthase III